MSQSDDAKTCKHCGESFKGYTVPNCFEFDYCSYECRDFDYSGFTDMPKQKTRPEND